jgi:hypothetical protein
MLLLLTATPFFLPLPILLPSPASETPVALSAPLVTRWPDVVSLAPKEAPAGLTRSPHANPKDVIFGIYLVVAVLFAARFLTGWVILRRLVARSAATEYEGVFESLDVAVPVTAGWINPKILLPSGWRAWDRAKLDAVLAHERAHIRRRDPALALFARLNRCVFWFHPLAWWLERKLAVRAEQACDDAALAVTNNRQQYAGILLEMAGVVGSQGRVYRHSLGMASHIGRRINQVMEERSKALPLTITIRIVLAIGSVPLIYAAGAVRVERQPALTNFAFPSIPPPAAPKLLAQQRPPAPPQPLPGPSALPQVRISVSVQDPGGRYVTGLNSSTFRVFEDGVEHSITDFYNTSPVSLAVVVNEDSAAVERLIPDLTQLRQALDPGDEMFLVYARGSRPQLASSIDELLALAKAGDARDNRSFGLDAVYVAADRLRTAKHPRRVLLAMSHSTPEDFSSHSEADTVAMAREADVVAYGPVTDLARFGIELRNQYVLVYNPPDPPYAGYHRIEVRLDNIPGLPPLTVRAREGYTGSP